VLSRALAAVRYVMIGRVIGSVRAMPSVGCAARARDSAATSVYFEARCRVVQRKRTVLSRALAAVRYVTMGRVIGRLREELAVARRNTHGVVPREHARRASGDTIQQRVCRSRNARTT
jgi:hypothetical protein